MTIDQTKQQIPQPNSNDAQSLPSDETVTGSSQETPDQLDLMIRHAADLLADQSAGNPQTLPDETRRKFEDLTSIRKLASQMPDEECEIVVTPRILGQFELLESLGAGGMGEVFRARNRKLGRIQAVKLLHAHRLSDTDAVARFHQEIQAIGQLEHPNIVAAHHADEHEGVPFLVMEFVDGQSLAEVARERSSRGELLSIGTAVNLVHQAAVGMHYVHEQGVLHRDLKPGNLLVDKRGVVRVLDLGLARINEITDEGDADPTRHELTRDGEILGTPNYMPPEQLRDTKSVDERADVYALGATLFYLLTGRDVYQTGIANGIMSKITAILNDPVPSVRSIRTDIPPKLDAIVTRALAKDPQQRVGSMAKLCDLLQPWVGNDVVSEVWKDRGLSPRARTTSNTLPATLKQSGGNAEAPPRRNWLAWAGGFGIVALLAGIIFRISLPDEGELVIESSDPNVTVSVKQVEGPAVESLELKQGRNEPHSLRIGTWLVTIDGANANEFRITPDRIEIGTDAPTVVRIQRRGKPDPTVAGTTTAPATVTAPDNAQPITRRADQPISRRDERERAWTPGELNRIQSGIVPQPANVDEVFDWQMQVIRRSSGMLGNWSSRWWRDLDPRGELVAWTTEAHVIVAELATGMVRHIFPVRDQHFAAWQSVQFSPTGDYLLIGTFQGQYLEIRTRDGRLLAKIRSPEPLQEQVAWMPAGDRFVRAFPNRLQLVDLRGQQLAELPIANNTDWIHFECHGESVLYLTQNGDLKEWTPQTAAVREITKLTPQQDAIWDSFFVNPDATQFLTHSSAQQFQLWDREGKLLASATVGCNQCDWSPDGRYLVCGDRSIYDSQTLELVKTLPLDPHDPHSANWFDPFWPRDDEIILLSTSFLGYGRNSGTGTVRRFHPSGRRLPTPDWPQPLTPASATFRDDSRLSAIYATSSANSTLINWDSPNAKPEVIKTEAGFNTPDSHAIAWHPSDGSLIAQGGVLLDANGKILRQFPSRAGHLDAPIWRRNGTHLAMLDYVDGKGVVVVLATEGQVEWTSPEFNAYIAPPAWSPDGRWLAWSTDDEANQQYFVNVVDFSSADKVVTQIAATSPHHQIPLSFSPDSRWIATQRWVAETTDHEVLAIRLPDLKEFRTRVPNGNYTLRTITWSDDSEDLLLDSRLMRIDLEKGPHDLNPTPFANWGWNLRQFVGDQLFVSSPDWQSAALYSLDGVLTKRFGFPMSMRPAHTDPTQSRRKLGSLIPCLSATIGVPAATAVGIVDLSVPGVQWMGIAFEDGETITYDATGAILQGPENIDLYLAHSITYPGGTTIAVTRDELHRRIAASPDQKAILWAADLTAKLEGDDPGQPLAIDTSVIDEFPAIDSIHGLDLSQLLELSDRELVHLSRFTGLKHLDLSNTPIQTLPSLSELRHLERANFAHSRIEQIELLRGMTQLKSLNLAGTIIQPNSAEALSTLTGLEELILDSTKMDSFGLLDLRKLTNLKRISLIDVDLREADLNTFRAALPACEVVTEK